MNKKLALVAGLFVVLCPVLFAQQTVAMHATIPFDFRMGNKLVPAGTYLIQTSGSVVTLREENGRALAVSFITIPESRAASEESGKLVFHQYGSDYFLARVWPPFTTSGQSLPPSAQERQLAKLASGPVQIAGVHASK
jgi:hypothetical protein